MGPPLGTLGLNKNAHFFEIFMRGAVVASVNFETLKCIVGVSRVSVFVGCLWGSPWNARVPGFRGVRSAAEHSGVPKAGDPCENSAHSELLHVRQAAA